MLFSYETFRKDYQIDITKQNMNCQNISNIPNLLPINKNIALNESKNSIVI